MESRNDRKMIKHWNDDCVSVRNWLSAWTQKLKCSMKVQKKSWDSKFVHRSFVSKNVCCCEITRSSVFGKLFLLCEITKSSDLLVVQILVLDLLYKERRSFRNYWIVFDVLLFSVGRYDENFKFLLWSWFASLFHGVSWNDLRKLKIVTHSYLINIFF